MVNRWSRGMKWMNFKLFKRCQSFWLEVRELSELCIATGVLCACPSSRPHLWVTNHFNHFSRLIPLNYPAKYSSGWKTWGIGKLDLGYVRLVLLQNLQEFRVQWTKQVRKVVPFSGAQELLSTGWKFNTWWLSLKRCRLSRGRPQAQPCARVDKATRAA